MSLQEIMAEKTRLKREQDLATLQSEIYFLQERLKNLKKDYDEKKAGIGTYLLLFVGLGVGLPCLGVVLLAL